MSGLHDYAKWQKQQKEREDRLSATSKPPEVLSPAAVLLRLLERDADLGPALVELQRSLEKLDPEVPKKPDIFDNLPEL